MDAKQNPISTIQHLRILKNRIAALKAMLVDALKQRDELDWDLEQTKARCDSFRMDVAQKRGDMEGRLEGELKDYSRQIKLAEDMLEKKKEEHVALMDYLVESKICERNIGDWKNFNWSSLDKMVLGTRERIEYVTEQRTKVSTMAALNQKAKTRINEMMDILASTVNDKARIRSKIEELTGEAENWRDRMDRQFKQINKMKNENERLNLLIKQCCVTNEPVSEFVAKNVRAKCNSFLNSDSSDELLSGLLKYKLRQDRTIKLLRHKENKLARDTSLLTIASDQTADQMQYYLNMVQNNQELNRNIGE